MSKTTFDGDELGDKLKEMEHSAPEILTPGQPICMRFDGKAFHTFTKGLQKPYDERFSALMIEVTKNLVKLSNAAVGYTQSDEISLIVMPDKLGHLPFSGRKQKLSSIYASYCSVFFNLAMVKFIPEKFVLPEDDEPPVFDCRTFSVPEPYNSLVIKWRQDDCSRNSVSMLAQSYWGQSELSGLSTYDLKRKLIDEKGDDWRSYPGFFKYGSLIKTVWQERKFTARELDELPEQHQARKNPDLMVRRRSLYTSHDNLHSITNLDGYLFKNEHAKFRYSCAI